jgi:uncharacterized membrane protein YbhN (UPF0104 family)
MKPSCTPTISLPVRSDQEAPTSGKKPRNTWVKYLQIFVVILIFFFLARSFIKDISKARPIEWTVDYRFLGLAILWLIIGLLAQAQVWKLNLKAIGISRSFKDIFKLTYLANMGRYLPGKVWSVLGVVYLGKKIEVPQTSSLLCSIVSQVTCVLAGFLFSGVSLVGLSALGHKISLWWVGFPLIFSIIFLHPYVYNKILTLASKLTKEKSVEARFPLGGVIKSVLLYLGVWLFHGLSFSFLALSLGDFSIRWFVYCLGIMPLAYLVGYLVWFSPGGWGIREGVMVILLKEFMPNYLAITVSLLSRLLFTIFEIVFFVIALKIKFSERKNPEITNSGF